MAESARLRLLREMLAGAPDDPELRYGLAMEYQGLGDEAAAEREYRGLIGVAADYVPTYLMLGQMLARQGREDEAKDVLRQGVAAARQTRNEHALGEIQALLDSLE
jgi:tetratricopeptide (TPR) repeat protein